MKTYLRLWTLDGMKCTYLPYTVDIDYWLTAFRCTHNLKELINVVKDPLSEVYSYLDTDYPRVTGPAVSEYVSDLCDTMEFGDYIVNLYGEGVSFTFKHSCWMNFRWRTNYSHSFEVIEREYGPVLTLTKELALLESQSPHNLLELQRQKVAEWKDGERGRILAR